MCLFNCKIVNLIIFHVCVSVSFDYSHLSSESVIIFEIQCVPNVDLCFLMISCQSIPLALFFSFVWVESMSSSKSTVSFNNSVGSQRLHRVDEDMDSMEFVSGDVSMKLARVKDQYASLGNKQRRLTEKEERFKNKYRWAEKRHKLRTGKCDSLELVKSSKER